MGRLPLVEREPPQDFILEAVVLAEVLLAQKSSRGGDDGRRNNYYDSSTDGWGAGCPFNLGVDSAEDNSSSNRSGSSSSSSDSSEMLDKASYGETTHLFDPGKRSSRSAGRWGKCTSGATWCTLEAGDSFCFPEWWTSEDEEQHIDAAASATRPLLGVQTRPRHDSCFLFWVWIIIRFGMRFCFSSSMFGLVSVFLVP